MDNTADYIKRLELSNIYREPVIQTVVQSLRFPPESKGLDAGCGTGLYTLMLADAAGLRSHVTGLDVENAFLEKARSLAGKAGLTERVAFMQGDILRLPFEENTFDWVFSMDLIGNLTTDPVLMLQKLAGIVKPGGMLYILNWSSQRLLPGYPVLEARLNATSCGLAPFEPQRDPELHPMCALHWLRQAGLCETDARTFAGDINAPLSRDMRTALADLFAMRWGQENPELSHEDNMNYQRLCVDDSPDTLLNKPWYHGVFTYTLFSGRVP